MKNTLLLLAKALLWFLLVMLLRPLNYLLDASLAAYVRVKEKCEDMRDYSALGSHQRPLFKVFAMLFVISLIFILTLYFYGKFVS